MAADRAILRTARLALRPVRPDDAGAITDGIAEWEVIRWLTSPPWPFAVEDARAFLASAASAGAMAILADGALIGVVHIAPNGELGYWLARSRHGRGYMTEAAAALVADHFRRGGDTLLSGHIYGNDASRNVLVKLGFRDTHIVVQPARALGQEVGVQRMELSAGDWGRRNPLVIETPRLRLAPLDADRDWEALSRIGGDPAVARMLYSVRSPWPEVAVRDWIADSAWRGRMGFRLGIWRKDGPLVGALGAGGEPVNVAYFLAPEAWGRGIATEAMAALLADLDDRFAPPVVEAEHFGDNPASGRVLAKLGFARVHETLGGSGGRLLPAPMWLWRRQGAGLSP